MGGGNAAPRDSDCRLYWNSRILTVPRAGTPGISPGLLHHQADFMDGKRMTMTPEAWTVIGTGVVILIAIATSNRQLRGEMNGLRGEMKEIHSEIGRLRERMAKLERLLEGLREAITGRKIT